MGARAVLRIVLIVVAVAVALYLIYRLRQPLRWIFIAAFLAVALSGPVNFLQRRMRRGFAITIVYLALLGFPVLLGMLLIPPLVEEGHNLARNAPTYANELQAFVQGNDTLRGIEESFDITTKLEEWARQLPSQIGSAAGTISSIGLGVASSLFAIITILVLSAFMLGSGGSWIRAALSFQPPERAARLKRVLDRIGHAIANYVAGAIGIAALSGVLAFVVLTILAVPFSGPLAVIVGLFALIPMVGATIAAILVGIVTLFNDFPTDTIIWSVWAIGYQQFENHVIQPQVQKRAVDIHPIVVVIAVLFGGTLFGVLGAIVAIPIAASIQITVREFLVLRRYGDVDAPPSPPSAAEEPPAPQAPAAPPAGAPA